MAQTWKLGVQNIRPGTYYRVSSGDVTTVGAVNGIAAVLFKSDWGARNTVINVDQSQMNNLREMFGTGEGVDAIKEALLGGATMVKAIRVSNDDGAGSKLWLYAPDKTVTRKTQVVFDAQGKASFLTDKMKPVVTASKFVVKIGAWTTSGKNLTATTDYTLTETNANGVYTKREIKLTASGLAKLREDRKARIYETYIVKGEKVARIYARFRGSRPFTCTLNTNLVTGKRQLTFYDGTQIFDSVSFEAGGNEVKSLQEALMTNKNFTLGKVTGKKLLKDFTGRAMAYGVNPSITVASYSKALDILERHYWNVVLADSTTNNIKNLLSEFVKQSYETGHLGMTVLAGTTGTAMETRLKYAAALNDWRVAYLLSGWTDINGVKYEGWRAAARIGGMVAACETNASLTHIVINNALDLLEPLSSGEMIQAEEKGCLVLSLNDDGQIWIDNAINTLITLGNDQDEGWKKIRRTKCRFELMTRVNRTCDKLIGRLNNDANGRATLITAMQGIINEMIAEGKLFFGSYVAEDERYKPVGDRAYFMLYIGDIDSIEKIYLDFRFSYANPFSE